MRRLRSGVMLTLLTVSTLALTFRIQPARSYENGTIYIRADGSIDPPTTPMQRNGDTYTLTDNIINVTDGIVIQRNNMTLDGAGYTLRGNGSGVGIELLEIGNVTIENMEITAFHEGIYLYKSFNNSLLGNTVIANTFYGIQFWLSSNNSIAYNSVKATQYGVGISLEASSNNSLRGNVMASNCYNFQVSGSSLSHYINEVDVSNTVDGKPIYYGVGLRNLDIPLDAGYVALVNCNNINVRNLTLTKNSAGLLLAFTSNCTIAENNITNNDDGISLFSSSNIGIFGNYVANNNDGICLRSSSFYNDVSGNNVANNWNIGIHVYETWNNSIFCNNVTTNGNGIGLESSSQNMIFGNSMIYNGNGINLYYSSSNRIYGNNMTNNRRIVWAGYSSNNIFYYNSFINNREGVTQSGSVNVWDNGYPSGGNYWGDYNGSDIYSGIYQNETGYDWIGDNPYVIDRNNTDRYPLMHPYSSETHFIDVAYRDLIMRLNQMQSDFNSLNSSITTSVSSLQGQISILNSTCNNLKAEVGNLTLTLNQTNSNLQSQIDSLRNTIVALQSQLNSLNSTIQTLTSNTQDQYNSLASQLDTISKVMYGLATMTAILIVTIVYAAVRKPKIKPQT